MLDYSDDEPQPQPVRRRNHSPDEGWRPFHRRPHGPPLAFTAKTRSIFRECKKKSGKFTVPARDQAIPDPFIISEFIPGKPLKQLHGLQQFDVNLKGKTSFAAGCIVVTGRQNGRRLSLADNCQMASIGGIFEVNEGDSDSMPERPPSHFDDHPDSFYKSMKTLVLLAQFFAVLPVSGIRGSNYNNLAFKWLHYKTVFWAVALLGTAFCFVCVTLSGMDGGTFEAATRIFYFACGVFSSLLMLNLSRNWSRLSREFAEVEFKFKKYGYPRRIGIKFKIFTILVLLVALVEHILSKLKNFEMALECAQHRIDFFSLAELFFMREYDQVFSICSYSFWKGALVLIADFLTNANWNFKDLFLCTISWSIAERFQQVHDLLDKVHGQDKPISFWKEVREDYNTLSVLTKRVDSHIRKLMFLSVGNNLFFICIQLFHSLKKKLDSYRLIYFFWSFGFLVLRTGFVAFSAARINDESKEPKTILYSVPQKNYTAEVRRFLTQLTTNEVALTGSGFFSITRSLILTIIGSVITYEIVLVQFGSAEMEDLEGNRTVCLRQ